MSVDACFYICGLLVISSNFVTYIAACASPFENKSYENILSSLSSCFNSSRKKRTAVPCPGGVAIGVCPLGMNCIAETPCTDQTYLDWLANNGIPEEGGEQEAIVQSEQTQCSSNEDCEFGLFCYQLIEGQGGTCGECQLNGMGCAVEEFCRISGCQTEQDRMGVSKCYTRDELNYDCGMRLDDASAECNTESMACESLSQQSLEQEDLHSESSQSTTTTITNSESSQSTNTSSSVSFDTNASSQPTEIGVVGTPTVAVNTTKYQNPSGNTYFCGVAFDEVNEQCLTSKPCPSSIASDFCAEHEGCFSAPSCTAEYESVTAESNLSPSSSNPSIQFTNAPSVSAASLLTSPTFQPNEYNNELATESTPPTPSPSTSYTLQPSADGNELLTQSLSPSLPPAASSELPTESTQPSTVLPNSLSPTLSPSDLAASLSPSKVPTVNTNFCGKTYEDHAQNCENSTPCPRGDECGPDESCFSSSPCSTLTGTESADVESNVGNFCGVDWQTMIWTVSDDLLGTLNQIRPLLMHNLYYALRL